MVETENIENHIPLSNNALVRKFLRIDFPLEQHLSEATLQPGKTYTIPFSFITPSHIPVQMCQHPCANATLYNEHLQLPPSLGRSPYYKSTHDMTPNEASISYSINFAVLRKYAKCSTLKQLHESIYPIYIFPTHSETAPLFISPMNKYYKLRTAKTLRKGVLRSNLGSLILATAQPPAIELSTPQPRQHAGTTLRLHLRFEPKTAEQPPPRMVSSDIKLKVMTFFGMETWRDYPDQTGPATWGPRQAYWSEGMPLCSEKYVLDWKLQKSERNTGEGLFYFASLDIAVALPESRVYPPTFHSCFLSRTYAFKMALSYRDHEKAKGCSSACLVVPVQICVL
ncbi:hypothetical protein N7532_002303 [Penicillium argentinense]|uniref:Arrestin-like N-terminal domain-containing protein n=1 Tax=Penicillium argentinense TaxID=1131581 RepID=A0A9W9G061_9EURO|nr:uncharacterized protein N7532_002303 [Penicillium argentinense]KAJ5109658.1 hypothetical protein N7532_002303 [Penicillium argentinense]